jgi:hypothetical protein
MNSRQLTEKEVEDRAIAYFSWHLASIYGSTTTIIATPDRDGVQGGCDFIVTRDDKQWAIDVTDVDAYSSQRSLNARVLRYREDIEKLAKTCQPNYDVNITFDPQAIPKKLNKAQLLEHLQTLLSKLSPVDCDRDHKDESMGFPIHYSISCTYNQKPDCYVGVSVGKWTRERQSDVLVERIDKKNNQLSKYVSKYHTADLLDVWDIQLSHPLTTAKLFSTVLHMANHSNINEIWLLYSPTEPYRILPLKLNEWLYSDSKEDIQIVRKHMKVRANMVVQGTA